MSQTPEVQERVSEIRRKGFWVGLKVTAIGTIYPPPRTAGDYGVAQGKIGTIEDIDWCDGWLMVDFGRGAILVGPEEVR